LVGAVCRFGGVGIVTFALSAVIMYQSDGAPVARYHLENAWPARLETNAAEASKNEVSIETLESVVAPMQRNV
jgi:hypothetical protein